MNAKKRGSPQVCSGALQLVEALPEEDRRREQGLSWRHLPTIELLAAGHRGVGV